MIYPENFEQKISFEQIKNGIAAFCISSLGKRQLQEMQFCSSYEQICKMQEETEEFRQILLFEISFPTQNYADLTAELLRLKTVGTFIEVENLCNLRASLQTIYDCLRFFETRAKEGKYPRLSALSETVYFDETIVNEIHTIVDDKGNIRSAASEKLQTIRREMQRLENEIDKNIKKILHQSKQSRLIEDDALICLRNGRMVLPVPAANKRKIKGYIHDESASGQTVFIEPQEIFESNNLLHNFMLDEHREIVRILTVFTDRLRPDIEHILLAFNYLSQLDFIRAKAKYALHIHACKPIINNTPTIEWKKAVHPLLYLNLKQQQKQVVPLDIRLGQDFTILIISGPNAGGKSVCLKTLALLQYMFQCGLPVSVSEISEFGIFEDIFIDIGDEQSIENDLSTYSSHLKNMKTMAEQTHAKSLFLIDELGGGTDPQYGGAIAEALVELLAERKACGLATTHFGNLKFLAENHDNIENGAMLFDEKEMKPLFQLKIGAFGTSFTFEIAKQIGLNDILLQNALKKIGKSQIRYEKLLQKLEQKQSEMEKQQKMLSFTDDQLAELIAEYTQKNAEVQQKRAEIIHQARSEAKNLLKDTNKLIEKTVREIRESKADKEVTKQLREEVKLAEQAIEKTEAEEKKQNSAPVKKPPEPTPIKLRDTVVIEDTQTIGEITAIHENDIVVSFNSVNLRTTIDKVQKISKIQQKKINKGGQNSVLSAINSKAENFNIQLDIRGMRASDAVEQLEQYLDDALLIGTYHVSILHGKGNGILRQVVRQYLAQNKYVKSYRDEHIERGGYGITVVELQ
ncbi:MAG: endonuclease MutS2 [Lentimicrobiaceae bacterium]|nr:endonuclease MutS2 [Lentimicrobiaceae bacterium]